MKYHHLIFQIISSFGLFASICGIASLHSQGQLQPVSSDSTGDWVRGRKTLNDETEKE